MLWSMLRANIYSEPIDYTQKPFLIFSKLPLNSEIKEYLRGQGALLKNE